MAVNAELYLRSSNARLRASTSAHEVATNERESSPVEPAASMPFGFVLSTDGLPLALTELKGETAVAACEAGTAVSKGAAAVAAGAAAGEGAAAVAAGAEAPAAGTLGLLPSLSPVALWQGLLPDLERQLGAELRAFRKRMLAGRVPADYVNDMFPGRRSGAWAIYRDVRTVEGQGLVEFCLYVRRGKDQLAVWEGAGTPDSLRANFSRAIPGPPPVADDVRRGLAAALVRHGLAGRR